MITKFDKLIIDYFQTKKLCGASITKFLFVYKEIDLFLDDFLIKHSEYIKKSYVIICIVQNIDLSTLKCKTCGKQQNYYHRNSKYCSHKCMISDPDYQKKRMNSYRKTCLEKYGVDNTYAVKEFIEKKKKSYLEHYGVEHPSQSAEFQEKVKETCLEKYGVEHVMQSDEFKKKSQETCLKKYGVKHFLSHYVNSETYVNPFTKEEIKEKIKETNLQKYGTEYFTQSENYKQYMNELKCSDKWNDIVFKNQSNLKKTSLEKYGKEHHNTVKSWNFIQNLTTVKPLFTFDEYQGSTKSYLWECLRCGTQFKSRYRAGRTVRVCPTCKISHSHISKKEQDLANFCRQFYPNLIQHDYSILSGQELDIVIPELHLALEFNRKLLA